MDRFYFFLVYFVEIVFVFLLYLYCRSVASLGAGYNHLCQATKQQLMSRQSISIKLSATKFLRIIFTCLLCISLYLYFIFLYIYCICICIVLSCDQMATYVPLLPVHKHKVVHNQIPDFQTFNFILAMQNCICICIQVHFCTRCINATGAPCGSE